MTRELVALGVVLPVGSVAAGATEVGAAIADCAQHLGLFPQGGRSTAAFHDLTALSPQPPDVRTQAVLDRIIVIHVSTETRRVVAAGALLLRRALMLA